MTELNSFDSMIDLKRWLSTHHIKKVESVDTSPGYPVCALFIADRGEFIMEYAHIVLPLLQLSLSDRCLYRASDAVIQEVREADKAQADKFKEHCNKERSL